MSADAVARRPQVGTGKANRGSGREVDVDAAARLHCRAYPGLADAVRRHVAIDRQSARADEQPREDGDGSRGMAPQNASHVRRVFA